MLKIAYHPTYVHDLPPGHRFPMLKYELIHDQLLYEGIVNQGNFFIPGEIDEYYISLAHDRSYWQRLKHLLLSEKEVRRIGFMLSASLVEREVRIAQGTIEASDYALEHGVAFNVAGGTHHAGSNWGEGFCLLNDQAIAAHYLLHEKKAKKILMVDLDVHQGNGTADIFKDNTAVFTFSVHSQRNFPFRKEVSDLDIGLADGVGDETYLATLKREMPMLIEKVRPDFIFYLSGVDVLASDKLGWLSLSKEGCAKRDEIIFGYCKRFRIPVQVSMGGGYSPVIGDIVDAHCKTFKMAVDILL
ncbi:histone deacetylase [Olivibacter sp. SDN3]|uniref:histone deacetylase family protein n=1 Tax=Olivibacter sp. SDN3 TaxID=2764720 RepID=UPI0016513F53|nr:histone deacetylase [Olivibacter sp. SDN3]QNL49006.1 histone deacetylase [Olivibacter sp. SDN3]